VGGVVIMPDKHALMIVPEGHNNPTEGQPGAPEKLGTPKKFDRG